MTVPVVPNKVPLGGAALQQYQSVKTALLNGGFLTCTNCSNFFQNPIRLGYFSQLTDGVKNQVPYDGKQTNISMYAAGLWTAEDALTAPFPRVWQNTPVCRKFVGSGVTALSQVQPPATDVYINTDPEALTRLTQGTLLHEVLHNLTGLPDFVPSAERNNSGLQPPFDLKTFVGIEPTPGVDPNPHTTYDISLQLETQGCAGNN